MNDRLCRVLELPLKFCVFCTGKQVSMCHFIQFYNVPKIYVEILLSFVYNVRIAVLCTQTVTRGRLKPFRKEF